MALRLLTESGDYLVAESVAGFSGASSLNDSAVFLLNKETFETNPLSRGWLVGANWAWNGTNKNMEPI